jgi:hypothetical protein
LRCGTPGYNSVRDRNVYKSRTPPSILAAANAPPENHFSMNRHPPAPFDLGSG